MRDAHESPQTIQLVDRGGETRLSFLAREARTKNGQIVAIKSGVGRVVLSRNAKEIAIWGSGDFRTAMITSEGYRSVQRIAQITVLTPPSIEVPGEGTQANPYVITDPKTGQFRGGWVRKIAIAPGPLGNLVLTDRTTYLTLYEYLIEDLIGLSKRNPAAVLWGSPSVSPADLIEGAVADHNEETEAKIEAYEAKRWRTDKLKRQLIGEDAVKRARKAVERKLWDFFEIEPLTQTGLWFDRTSQGVATVFRTYAQTGKFGLRKLEAIAFRNVMRDHPLTPGMTIDPRLLVKTGEGKNEDEVFSAPVFFHEQIEGEAEIRELFRAYESGIRTASLVSLPGGAEVDRDPEPERVSVSDANAEAIDEEQKGEVESISDERPEEVSAGDKRGGLIAKIKTGEEILGSKEKVEELRAEVEDVREKGLRAPTPALLAYWVKLSSAVNTQEQEG